MRLAEPFAKHAVFGNAIEHTVRADDGGVHGAGENERADHNDKSVKDQARDERSLQIHRQAADQVLEEALADVVRDDHHREK